VLLLTLTLLITLYALIHMAIIFKGLYAVYTKTMNPLGREPQIDSGGVELSTYEALRTETSIQNSSHLARYGGGMGPDG